MPAPWYQRFLRPGGFWILLLVLLAYWPLSTFQYSISAGDTLDCWLPWRFFLSATMQDGAIPAWNPYQQMGYPVHADLQGPAWYPEALLIGGTLGHGAYTLSLLFLAYVALGGWGMYRFALQLGAQEVPAFLAGSAYALSGFFTGHAMHFYAVISAAWMPWLFLYAIRMLDAPTARNALVVAVFLFFLLTGGNHTFLIVASYPLLAFGLHAVYKAWVTGARERIPKMLGAALFAAAVAMLLAIGTFHALWEVGPHIDRAHHLGLADAAVNPFTLRAAVSQLIPWVATNNAAYLGTDVPMANGYYGVLMLAFACVGMIRAVKARERIMLATAAVAFVASLGPLVPVHEWLWRVAPGMDLFRFPAYFFYFVPFMLLPVAAKGMTITRQDDGTRRILLTVLAILALGVLFLMVQAGPLVRPEWDGSVLEWMNAAEPATRVIVNGTLAIILLAMAGLVILRRWSPWILTSLVVLELLLSVQFTQWATTLGPESPAAIEHAISTQPGTPIVPELRPMMESRDGSEVLHHLWRNTQLFRGIPTHDGFNSFWMKDHQALEWDHPALFEAMQGMPLVYLATHPIASPDELDPFTDSAVVVLDDPSLLAQVGPAGAMDRVELRSFTHNAMGLRVRVANDAFLVVQQNHYPGWRIQVDGTQVPVHQANVAAFGALIPAGEHEVRVEYDKPVLKWLRLISFGTFFLVLIVLARTTEQGGRIWLFAVAVLFCGFLWAFFGQRPKAERVESGWADVKEHFDEFPQVPVLVNTDRALALGHGPWRTVRIDRPDVTEAMDASLGVQDPDSVWIAWAGLPFTASMRVWAMDHFGLPQRRIGGDDTGAWLFAKNNFGGPAEEVLYHEPKKEEVILVDPASPYTPAFRIPIGTIRSGQGDHLVIDLRFRAARAAEGRVVMERKRGERTTDYWTVPFGMEGSGGVLRSVHVVRPVNTLGHDDEELVVYLWNASDDPVSVSDLRIRSMDLEEWCP